MCYIRKQVEYSILGWMGQICNCLRVHLQAESIFGGRRSSVGGRIFKELLMAVNRCHDG
jgi:hypothetical protein